MAAIESLATLGGKFEDIPKGKGMFDNVKGKLTCWLGFGFALLLLLLP